MTLDLSRNVCRLTKVIAMCPLEKDDTWQLRRPSHLYTESTETNVVPREQYDSRWCYVNRTYLIEQVMG